MSRSASRLIISPARWLALPSRRSPIELARLGFDQREQLLMSLAWNAGRVTRTSRQAGDQASGVKSLTGSKGNEGKSEGLIAWLV